MTRNVNVDCNRRADLADPRTDNSTNTTYIELMSYFDPVRVRDAVDGSALRLDGWRQKKH